jgi:hypothetical protein
MEKNIVLNGKTHCIVGADRISNSTILFIGTKKECESKLNPWFRHPTYGGIDAHIYKYDDWAIKQFPKDKSYG